MSFARTYDAQQSIATLAALPGTVVVRLTPAQRPIGSGSGCVLIVGEPTNDQASDSTKTLVNTIREITSGDQIANDYGGLNDYIGTASDGWEGNLAKALALPGLEFARLAVIAPQLSAGQVTFTRPNPGNATMLPTIGAPWRFSAGAQLVLDVDGGGADTATFDAAAASVVGSGFSLVSLNGDTLVVSVDGGPNQTITFGVAAIDLATVVAVVNAGLVGAYASADTGELRITSDRKGTGSGIEIVSGTALTELGLSATSAVGTGDVSDITAVTAAEWAAVIEADIAGVSVDTTTGAITSDTAGSGGSITYSASSTDIIATAIGLTEGTTFTGGDDDAEETTIPAGTRVSNSAGTRVYMTLEALTFPAGASGTSLSQSVRVRPLNSSTSSLTSGQCNTIVDTLDDTTFEVTNAAGLTPPSFDTAYSNALAASLGDTGIAAEVDYVICRRHTTAVHAALRSHATTAKTGKRPRVVFLAPPVGTANATASGSSTVGVGVGRSGYYGYCYPGFQARLADDVETLVNMTADIPAAHLASVLRPEQNIGEDRERLTYVLGLESGLDVTPTKAQYQTWLGLGIMPLQVVDGHAEFLNDVTTDITNTQSWGRLFWVRMTNFLTASLHSIGGRWSKKLRSAKNKEGLRIELESFFSGLKSEDNADLQRIADYAVDDESGNTPATIAAGLHVVKHAVQYLAPMDVVVMQLEAGTTVKVSAEAIAQTP